MHYYYNRKMATQNFHISLKSKKVIIIQNILPNCAYKVRDYAVIRQ